MNVLHTLLPGLLLGLALSACGGDTLDQEPRGTLTEEEVTTVENLDGLVTATYSYLGNDHYTAPMFLWPTGNLRAGDAHKGGNGASDIFVYHALSMYNLIIPDMESYPPDFVDLSNKKWVRDYTGISRANTALRAMIEVSESDYPQKAVRQGELRFLRGVFYFDLKIHYKNVPYVDETVTSEEATQISNVALSDQALWDRIAGEFRFAAENLPETQGQVGRANRFAAKAFLAKTLLYQAYVQNDRHEVVSIDAAKLEEVVNLVEEIEASGLYGLLDDFGDNFLPDYDNSEESVFAIQRSVDDGSVQGNGGRGSWPTALNYPVGNSGFGCCGFHIPTENFVNSFKTQNGLPYDDANDEDYELADPVDPRLDHTVSMEGKPFKYATGTSAADIHQGDAWARNAANYGNNVSMKELVSRDSWALAQNGPFFISAMNTVLIRYADVLLWKAEALIQLDRYEEALPIINAIRNRAAASTGKLANTGSTYDVALYPAFASKQEAFTALRRERRLELGLEGHRFFDLVRWGVTKETIDAYLAVEKTRKPYLEAAEFTAGRDEYLPIPQQQINLSHGLYEQNPGY